MLLIVRSIFIMREAYSKLVVLLTMSMAFAVPYAYAAEISDVTISEVTDNSASIYWNTDINTDASINYGLDSSVGIVRDPTYDKKKHSLKIENLDPLTQYHFRVISSDPDGNKSATAGLVFTTLNNQKAIVDKIIKDLDKVIDPKELVRVVEKVQQVAKEIIRPPAIIGLPRVSPESDRATITWTSDRKSGSMINLAADADYHGGADPYSISQGQPRETVTEHKVTVTGLKPATHYHFQVSSQDSTGLTGVSDDDTFTTKSLLPVISPIKITRIQEKSATISWDTRGLLAKGRVEYKNLKTKIIKSVGDPVLADKHSIQLSGLEFGTRYQGTAIATNQAGDEVVSKPFVFVTVRDVVPPAITKVSNESTLFPSEDTKIQTIISWSTDEPATCQVFYSQGLVRREGDNGQSLTPEANPLTAHTQVIVGFAGASVYKFWIVCQDITGNESRSDDFVLITPVKEKSIIDVILENFQGTFGWVNKIGK